MAVKKEEFYEGADFDTLQKLETRCQTSENNRTAKLISLELAQNEDDKHGTLATYERVPLSQVKIGLIFREFKTDGEVRMIEAQLESEGNTKM
ncbi:MAG TPA: hypothetical protein VGB00_16475, partial [Pyrinomonadaceae bacterium]